MRRITVAALLALAACSWQGPPLAGYPGLQYKVISYYDDRAMERNAACPLPRMDAVQAKAVDETPTQVVMNVRYHQEKRMRSADQCARRRERRDSARSARTYT